MEQPDSAPETEQPQVNPDTEPTWHTLGERLRLAREASGLSLAEVAERTKVRPGILADIEADAHERLPALTYAIGFVKAYARTVGVDPVEAGNAYRQESQKIDPAPSMVDLQPLEARRLPSRGLVVATSFLILVLLGGFWAWGAGWLTPALQQTEEAAVVAKTAEVVAPPAEEALPPVVETRPVVTLTANDEVWLEITDSGETFFTGILAPGQTLTLPEGRPWLLRAGRAGALDVRVGDQQVPPLGGPIETLRNVSLTPEALLARLSATEAARN